MTFISLKQDMSDDSSVVLIILTMFNKNKELRHLS